MKKLHKFIYVLAAWREIAKNLGISGIYAYGLYASTLHAPVWCVDHAASKPKFLCRPRYFSHIKYFILVNNFAHEPQSAETRF